MRYSFLLDVNPEPWAIGPVSVGRGKGGQVYPNVGRNQQLFAYQQAIKEAIEYEFEEYAEIPLIKGPLQIDFFFWRQQAVYTGKSQKQIEKNQVDVTNMQKATEDALQGVLFANDRDTVRIQSIIVEQGPDVRGRVGIVVEWLPIWHPSYLLPPDLFGKYRETLHG